MFAPLGVGEQLTVTAHFDYVSEGVVSLNTHGMFKIIGQEEQGIAEEVSWLLEPVKYGNHVIDVVHGERTYPKSIIVSERMQQVEEEVTFEDNLNAIRVHYNELKPLGGVSIFGWEPGWLGVYIVCSIVFSIVLRKSLKLA